jgi:hypothetical protein
MKIDVVSRMLADSTVGVEAVKLDFDLVLYDVPCDRISFVKEVTKGTVHVNEYGNFDKFAMDDGITVGCQVRGSHLLDKVGGNFRFNIEEDKLNDRPYNISHSIVNLAFSPALGLSAREKLPDLAHSISNILTIVPDQTGVYHYAIQVGRIKPPLILLLISYWLTVCYRYFCHRWSLLSTRLCMESCRM